MKGCKRRDQEVTVTGNVDVTHSDKKTRARQAARKISLRPLYHLADHDFQPAVTDWWVHRAMGGCDTDTRRRVGRPVFVT